MQEIELSQGKVATIDDDDFELIGAFNWSYHHSGYAVTMVPVGRRRKMVLMHRMVARVLNRKDCIFIDHINGDRLDNRRENLRVVTNAENAYNRGLPSDNTSGYKGVSFNKRAKKWESSMVVHGKRKHLGYFDDPVEAAIEYDRFALIVHGDLARTNF